jgi:hypothetical protein
MQSETIYIPLVNEGTPVWRPVSAKVLSPAVFQIEDSEPEDEEWLYTTGQHVQVEQCVFADGKCGWTATSKASLLPVSLTYQELNIAQNALNEICNGIELGEAFETRVGATLADARALLAKIAAIQRP